MAGGYALMGFSKLIFREIKESLHFYNDFGLLPT